MTARTGWIALAAALLVAAPACSSSNTPPQNSSATTSAGPATPASCTALGGTVGPDRFCTVHMQTPGYTVDMHYPADYPDQTAVTNMLKRQRDGFIEASKTPHAPNAHLALNIKGTTYRSSGTPTAGTQSLVFEEFTDLGGAHPETEYGALSYDLDKQAPITFNTLFKPGSNPVAVLDPIVGAELARQFRGLPIGPNLIGDKMYQSFALTDDAVIFFIGQGMWTIEAAGPTQVSVSRNDLAPILA
jgi:hypothetical protein